MQSWQTCALSGELIETPVISKVSGHIFEKRLIEKHIESTGTCPITGRPLSLEDLIEVKVSRVQRPRPVTATSIPALLSLLQNEWDALQLEQFQLKQHLEQVRQELTHALYQHDAACRVIAKLIKERDQARQELSQLQHKLKIEVEAPQNESNNLPQEILNDIQDKTLQLSQQRKRQRKDPNFFEQFPNAEILSNYKVQLQLTEQQANTSIDIHENFIIVGSDDGTISLYKDSKLLYQHKEQGTITSVKFYQKDENVNFISSSENGKLNVYQYNDQNNEGNIVHSINIGQSIKSLVIHPIQYVAILVTKGGLIIFCNLQNGQTYSIKNFEGQTSFTAVGIHPDGQLLAIGDDNSQIKIWNIAQSQLLTTLNGQEGGQITSISFSENGAQMASSTESEVALWNLRTSEISAKLYSGLKIGGVGYDKSGQYLSVLSQKTIFLVDAKKGQEFCKIQSHLDLVTGISFEKNHFVTCSIDKLINVYGN